MSSLQKFHRRTQSLVPIVSPFPTIGSGSNTNGYWLGSSNNYKLIVAPKSTELYLEWGSSGTVRGTTNTTDGLTNTNTLYAFGSAAHPAAYYCKTLATGGYNTWYLPAVDEMVILYSNKSATPFATSNAMTTGNYFWSSTELNNATWGDRVAIVLNYTNGAVNDDNKSTTNKLIRAVRRTTV